MKCNLLNITCVAAFLMGVMLNAQQMTRMNFEGQLSQYVSGTQFSTAASPAFSQIFASSPQHAALQDVSFVITNNSPKPIIGIAFKYKIIDSAGGESPYTLKTHSYLNSFVNPLMNPGERMLVSPDSFIAESLIRPGHGVAGTVPSKDTIAKFSAASQVLVTIDAIIFGDGEVAGANELHLAQAMQDLKAAANIIQRQVEAARTTQQNPQASISELLATPRSAADPVARHASHLARLLLATQNFESDYSYIGKIQSMPTLFRKDGLPL